MNTRRREALTIGKLSDLTGVKLETIRYYERIGLVASPPRTTGGHRVYDADHVKQLSFVRRCRELGFPLREIRTLFGMVAGGHSCGEMRDLALAHAATIRRKIADLRRMERTLTETAARCRGNDAPDCPIVDVLFDEDTAGRDGR